MAEAFDAVFVGGGHNALAGAVHFASRGWSVAVFERNATVGGAARTAQVTLPGFRHDLYATNLGLFAGSAFFAEHGKALAEHGLSFVPATDCFATPLPSGRWFGVSQDAEATAARAAALAPGDGDTWRAMTAAFAADAPHLFALLGSPMTRQSLASVAWTAWRAKGTAGCVALARLLLSTPREFVDRFEAPETRAALAVWGLHLDFAPDTAGGALFPYLEAMADQTMGMVVGRGGVATIVDAMTARIEALGGTVRTGAEVAGIMRTGGRCVGVRLADGTVVRAKRAVIASTTPQGLVRLLPGGSGDAAFDRGAKTFRHGPGTMMVHLAMDALPEWSAGPELKRFLYVHLAPDLETMARTYADALAGLLPAEPVVVVGQQSAVDPSRAPEGKHTLWLQVRVLPGTIRGDAAGTIAARDWDAAREPYADRVIDIVERYAPGTRERILGRFVESPADLECGNPNLVGGDSVCGSHHLSQNFVFRPMPGRADWSTPVAGLHLIGAATWPGGGLGAGSGYMLARRLAGRRGGWRL